MRMIYKALNFITTKAIPIISFLLIVFSSEAFAVQNLGNVASSITVTFQPIALLITGASYIAGLGFAIGAIMKFKQHKDNPTQITIGIPVAMLFVSASLLFLPTILGIAGGTMFGNSGTVAGPSGTIFS